MVDPIEGYELIPDAGDGWQPSKREIRRQREAEDIRRHARELAAKAPPMSDETRARVAALLSRRTPKHELMRWRLRLFCGHVVTRTAHHGHTTVHGAFTGSTRCTECGLDPATIVAAEAIGLVEERPGVKPVARSTDECAGLERAIVRHERELARLRAELDAINAP
jgi:hypothetical protein